MNRILKRVACLASAATMLTGAAFSATAAEMRADLKTFLSRAGLSAAEIQGVNEGTAAVYYRAYVNVKSTAKVIDGAVRAIFSFDEDYVGAYSHVSGGWCTNLTE